MSKLKINVDGDATGGWIVGVADGTNFKSFSPEAADADDAAAMAREAFIHEFAAAADLEVEVVKPTPAAKAEGEPSA